MNWKLLLEQLSDTIHTRIEGNMIYYDKQEVQDNWLGFPPAAPELIGAKEKELGLALPPSYREFLSITNGFRQISFFAGSLFPVEKIGWTKDLDPDFLKIMNEFDVPISDDEYFVYGEKQRSEAFKLEYLNETVQISEWVDGSVLLINPLVKFGDEWEAWVYANWYPGAHRYKSFKELVEAELASTLELLA
jgi:hypothetical protein